MFQLTWIHLQAIHNHTYVFRKVSTVCAFSRLSLCACAVTSSIIWEATDDISWNSCNVYVCPCALNMFKTIEGTTDCEIRSVISFLNARDVLPSEIHHQICQVYGDNAKSDGMVRKWVRMFTEGRENVHDEARSGRPSLVNADLVRKVNERVLDDRRFKISDLSQHFPQISRTLLYNIVSSHLGYRRPHSLRRVYKTFAPLR